MKPRLPILASDLGMVIRQKGINLICLLFPSDIIIDAIICMR